MDIESLEGPGKVRGRKGFEEDGEGRNGLDEGAAVRVGVEVASRVGFGGVGGFGREEVKVGGMESLDVRRNRVISGVVVALEVDGRRVGKSEEVGRDGRFGRKSGRLWFAEVFEEVDDIVEVPELDLGRKERGLVAVAEGRVEGSNIVDSVKDCLAGGEVRRPSGFAVDDIVGRDVLDVEPEKPKC